MSVHPATSSSSQRRHHRSRSSSFLRSRRIHRRRCMIRRLLLRPPRNCTPCCRCILRLRVRRRRRQHRSRSSSFLRSRRRFQRKRTNRSGDSCVFIEVASSNVGASLARSAVTTAYSAGVKDVACTVASAVCDAITATHATHVAPILTRTVIRDCQRIEIARIQIHTTRTLRRQSEQGCHEVEK